MAIAIVGGALLRIAQDAVGFGGFLEFFFGLLIVGIAIRMVFQRQLAVGALERRRVAIAADAEDFVIIALGGVHCYCFFTATFTMAGRSRRPRKL